MIKTCLGCKIRVFMLNARSDHSVFKVHCVNFRYFSPTQIMYIGVKCPIRSNFYKELGPLESKRTLWASGPDVKVQCEHIPRTRTKQRGEISGKESTERKVSSFIGCLRQTLAAIPIRYKQGKSTLPRTPFRVLEGCLIKREDWDFSQGSEMGRERDSIED